MSRYRRSVLKNIALGGVVLTTGCINALKIGESDPKDDTNTTEKPSMARRDSAEHAKEVLKKVGKKYGDISGIEFSGMGHTDEEGWIVLIGVSPNRADDIDRQIPDRIEGVPIQIKPTSGPEVIGPVTVSKDNVTSNSSNI